MRLRAEIHMIAEAGCVVFTIEREAGPDDWRAVDQILNHGSNGVATLLPNRPLGEQCDQYHIYTDKGLVHDRR